MSSVSERMKSPSFKRKLKVSQSLSTVSPATSAPPTTTAHNSAPPLPPMSSHPALMRKQNLDEFPRVLHQQNSSLPSLHTDKGTDGSTSVTSSSKRPPLPPKLTESHLYVPFIPMLQRSATSDLMKEDDMEYSHTEPRGKSLSELNRSEHCNFPMQVLVTTGFQGPSKKSTILDGEILNLLCLKKRKLVAIETLTGKKVNVPLNSSLQFGILYNPNNNLKQAVKGFHYKTAGDILSLSVLPKLICATKKLKAGKEKYAVQKKEVFLVREATTNGPSKRALSCIQMDPGKHKKLFEDSAGPFTTQPASVKMFLPEIINQIDLPQMAVVFFPEKQPKVDFTSEKGFLLAPQEVVKITEVISEKSVLATYYSSSRIGAIREQNGRSSPLVVLDIPMDHPTLKVRVIQSNPSEQEKITKHAKELVHSPPTEDQHHVRIGSDAAMFDPNLLCERSDPQQQIISSESSPLLARKELTLELQSAIQDPQIPAQNDSSLPLDTNPSPLSVEAYAFFDPKKFATPEDLSEEDEDYEEMKSDLQSCKSESPSLSAFIEEVVEKKLQELDDTKQKQIESLREEIAKLRSVVEDLQGQCKEIQNQQGISAYKFEFNLVLSNTC